ncbi:hydantoinase/oxoprolinase N-terminal domain-containing protein [Methanolobus profundi]|uniref:N-methylhydantoinase A/oxoprolinase/acetone carboxylase, beta subunit n=1 Tax=Methanolobus profundi TaxID=487685 RepID=A0A1I4PV03_9EURY|nr:hydantoinase/oxoprolinase family protein [Methanolobus profundi]SFM31661.1 N-methylhydantoinase A/oxoprolinase/acetone carboxylase, beta subunit [Methanolobus profundi]
MQFSLGIDAGGTYTDAILVRDSDGSVVDSSKALTTYPDLVTGIRNAIEGIGSDYLKDITLVSVSTTLATNTVLEGTGSPVALILAGDHPVKGDFPAKHVLEIAGGHGFNGEEIERPDLEAVRKFAEKVKDDVAAFAVSSFFSIRNPEHELVITDVIHELTGLPVVCGHELSQDLGAYERAVTAALNAQLLPISHKFILSVIDEIKRKDINARLLMLKCDGTVVGLKDALDKPVETIFSGPAASLVGASFLSGLDTCAVVDVGGTSTDVSAITDGIPELSNTGAVVGGWKTRVRATRMETSAMGGDSHVWTRSKKINVGPRRVIPLCLASSKFPGFIEKLKRTPVPKRSVLDRNIQPTKFFMRSGFEPKGLEDAETEVLSAIGDEPMSLDEIAVISRRYPSSIVIDSLIQKRLIQPVGFTPTDALHVLGEYALWDARASEIGAEKLGKLNKLDAVEFSKKVKDIVAKNMAFDLMSFLLPGIERSGIRKIVDGQFKSRFKIDVPVVLLGGPVSAYQDIMSEVIDADIIIPEHAEVGNAAGALFGKGIKRIEIIIRPMSIDDPDEGYFMFSPVGRASFKGYRETVDHANEHGRKLVLDYMSECGVSRDFVEIKATKKTFSPEDWKHDPVETVIQITGIGYPKKFMM